MDGTPLGRLRLCAAAFLAGNSLAFAAAPDEPVSTDYVLREWHASDGLPSDQIARVSQDRAGFLWVATTEGVVRFDGSHFARYELSASPPPKARAIVWNSRVGLVAALASGGLAVLDQGSFVPWHPSEYRLRRIVSMFSEPNGVLWMACDDSTVFRQEGEDSRRFGAEDGLARSRVRTFATDRNGGVWISGEGYVAQYVGGHWTRHSYDLGSSEVRLASSSTGGPWMITQDRVRRIDGERCVDVAPLPPRLGAHYVQSALEDRNGALWIGTRSQGLHIVTEGVRRRVPTSHDDIYAVLEDREGNIWAGTNGGGLNRIRHKSYHLYDKSAGLLDNYSYTGCTDTQGNVWLANRDGGVVRLRGRELDRFTHQPGAPTISAVSVFPRPGGGIGVTAGRGIYETSADGSPYLHLISAIPQSTVSHVSFVAKNGDTWFALEADKIARLRGDGFDVFDGKQGMDGRGIRAITEDNEGNLWAGGTDGKLFRFEGGRFERVPLPGVETGAIQTIRIEPDNRVWLGTLAAGLVVWDKGRISTCGTRQGMPDDDLTQILPDDHGFIWFASKHSIFRLGREEVGDALDGRRARVSPRLIGPEDGIKDIACSGLFQPGAWKSPDGTLWFATRRGVLALDPKRQLASPPPPPVSIEEVTCDDRLVPLAHTLKVDGQVRKLEFRFGVLSLSQPESVRAEYRLDGFDRDWVVAPPNHRATYPRLPPGTYQFQVKAGIGDGAATETHDTLALIIIPRWWQTDWFHLGALFTGALGVTVTVRTWSHRRLRKQVEKLKRESAIRTRIAQNIHDDLGANLTQISLLTQVARRSPEVGAKSIDQIHATVSEITRSMDEIVWAVNPKFDDIESLAGYLGDFARNFLSAAGIRCRLELPQQLPAFALASEARHHLFLCCKEALHNVVKHSRATEATISIAVEHSRLAITVADNGRGPNAVAPAEKPDGDRLAGGNGLQNMRQRMAEIGGSFLIQVGANGGTVAAFCIECQPGSS